MTSLQTSVPLRLGVFVVAVAAVAVALVWHLSGQGESIYKPGWKTVEYEGVSVEIPASWERLPVPCGYDLSRWAPPGSDCATGNGVTFYGSATFDVFEEPGVRRIEATGQPDWGGHVYNGGFAVYVSGDDREAVRRILRSAR